MGTTQGHCEVCGEPLGFPASFRHGDTKDCIKWLKAERVRLLEENAELRKRPPRTNCTEESPMDDNCDCPACKINRLTEEVAELRQRVEVLEESPSIPVLGVLGDSGIVNWHDKEPD